MESSSFRDVERNPDAAARRLIQQMHNQDGLPEILIGVVFLATAGLSWADVLLPPVSKWHRVGALLFGFLIPALILGGQWAIKSLRRRYLIERAGYVEFKPCNRRHVAVVFGVAFVVGAVTAFVVAKGVLPPASWFVAGIGVLGGVLAAYSGRIFRFVIGGGIMAVVGILVGLSRVSLGMGQAILYGFMGVLSLGSGVVVLVLFLHKPERAEG